MSGDGADDPFDEFDREAADREGDPFEHLDGGGPADDESTGSDPRTDPFEYVDERRAPDAAGQDVAESAAGSGRSDVNGSARAGGPFADVDVSSGDPFESGASAFEAVDVEGVDPDEVWGRLTGEGEPRQSSEAREDDVVEVSKHAFCEGCEHFSPPPNVRCGHEGTSILEFTGVETVRIADCPIVVEQRELGGIDG